MALGTALMCAMGRKPPLALMAGMGGMLPIATIAKRMDSYRGDDGYQADDGGAGARARVGCAWLFGIAALLAVGFTLEAEFGFPIDATLRIGCIGFCQYLIYAVGKDYRTQRWPWIAFWCALALNVIILFSPLTDRPASRGEIMLFAPVDTAVLLIAAIAAFKVDNVHQRAMRQQMYLGLVVATSLCAFILAATLMDPRTGLSWGFH
ncbi:MAG: hypothetical protein ABIW33_04910 [Sphingomicrobium sp.]